MRDDADGPDGLQLAEALWLAASRRPVETAASRGAGESPEDAPDGREPPESTPPAGANPAASEGRTSRETESPRSGLGLAGDGSGITRSFLSPSGRAVGELPRLARALRPLSRRVADPFVKVLDTEATVEQFAHTALKDPRARLTPILAPARRRAWELVLLVDRVEGDAPPTHLILEEVARELKEMLRWQGAFRVVLAPWLEQKGREVTSGSLEHLASPTGDRLFVVLTDMRTSAWASGSAFLYLGKLARRAPVSVWHVLPEDLWRRTAAGAPRWLASNGQAGTSSGSWRVRERPGIHVPRPGDVTPDGFVDLALPLAALNPESLSRWARFVAGDGRVALPAIRLRVSKAPRPDPPLLDADPFTTPEETPLEERLSAFFDLASPKAQRLAALCAGVPLTLPILRLVQQAFLPGSPPSLVSEVLMSTLLEPSGEGRFVWRPGVAEELVLRVSVPDTLEVRERIGEFLGASKETMARFEALILRGEDVEGMVSASVSDADLFAYLSASTMQKLGFLRHQKQIPVPEPIPKDYKIFLNYARQDDREGRITEFRELLEKCLFEKSGNKISIFQDKEILGGDSWESKIYYALDSSAIMIPILTPGYFNREWCRRELQAFLDKPQKAGKGPILIPVYWIATPEIENISSEKDDTITRYIKNYKYDDWRSLFSKSLSDDRIKEKLDLLADMILNRLSTPLLNVYKAQMASISGGTFARGSDDYDEKNGGRVTLSPFKMGRTPVTVAMYREFCEHTNRAMPDAPSGYIWQGRWDAVPDHPMVNVSWDDCKAYADWAGLALPTEAQWECAARGGKPNWKYPWGTRFENSKLWCSVGKSGSANGTAPVIRTKNISANGYGLTDMAGNVWEWCADWYGPYLGDASNPVGPASGSSRVLRGGSWFNVNAGSFRCADRSWGAPEDRYDFVGFRLASPGP